MSLKNIVQPDVDAQRKIRDAIFIWTPKVAGTSIFRALKKYSQPHLESERPLLKRASGYEQFENQGLVSFGHVNVLNLYDQGIISAEFFNNAFKFCFVRNPWDRFVSLYFYFFTKKKISCSFPVFCEKVRWSKLPWLGLDIPPVSLYHTSRFSQCNPQVDWITDKNGKVFVDFIGRFEQLEKDFSELCSHLEIKEEKLPHKNKTEHRDYREYYNKHTRKIVGKIYKQDIELLGYEF